MLYMLINVTKSGLSQQDYAELGKLAQSFYDRVPEGIALRGDWSANDGSRTFALIETENPALLDDIQRPFRPYVDITVIPVTAVKSWRAS